MVSIWAPFGCIENVKTKLDFMKKLLLFLRKNDYCKINPDMLKKNVPKTAEIEQRSGQRIILIQVLVYLQKHQH